MISNSRSLLTRSCKHKFELCRHRRLYLFCAILMICFSLISIMAHRLTVRAVVPWRYRSFPPSVSADHDHVRHVDIDPDANSNIQSQDRMEHSAASSSSHTFILSPSRALDYMHAKWLRATADLKRAALLRRHQVSVHTDFNDFSREQYISRHCGDDTLRAASFNVFNLQMQWSIRKHMAARALAAVAPDIIALQEVRFASDQHQAHELQQLLLSKDGHIAYQHLLYQRVTSQDSGKEEGLAILSRHPVVLWGFCILSPSTHSSPIHWFSDSGQSAPIVPDHSRIVLFARIDASAHQRSKPSEPLVDVFVTHWPVADRDQCAAASQTKCFADLIWRQKQQRPTQHIPQILTGDLNVYMDFEWPVDFLTGEVVGTSANKCWPHWQPHIGALERDTENVWFRDAFHSLFSELTYTNPHVCSEQQHAASLSVAPCLDVGHTFPFDNRADSCRPDRTLVRDAMSAASGGDALLEVFASTFGEQQLSSNGESITPSDHRGLLVCFAARSGTHDALTRESRAVQSWRQASRLLSHVPVHVPQHTSLPELTPKLHFVNVKQIPTLPSNHTRHT